jgi:hypothetical protein
MRWRLYLALSVGVVLLGTGCSPDTGSAESIKECQQVEALGYPAIEELAGATLKDVEYSVERAGACEDTGKPRTYLLAYVDGWVTRDQAISYFKRHGWKTTGGLLTSPDGDYTVNNSTSSEADSVETFVETMFSEVLPDSTD